MDSTAVASAVGDGMAMDAESPQEASLSKSGSSRGDKGDVWTGDDHAAAAAAAADDDSVEPLPIQQVNDLAPSACCTSRAGLKLPKKQEGKNPDAPTSDTQQFPTASSDTTTTKISRTTSTSVRRGGGLVSSRTKRQRLLDATALLRDLSRNKDVLDEELSAEEKTNFLDATGRFFYGHPDRQFYSLATKGKRRVADQQTLGNTGIRRLRDQPVFITPSPPQPSPPSRLLSPSSKSTQPPSSQKDTTKSGITTKRGAVKKEEDEAQEREKKEESFDIPDQTTTNTAKTTQESRRCYVCKARFTSVHHFYDQLCPDNDLCAPLNFRKRSELADLSGKVALLTGGRIKIGYQAAIKLLRCGCARVIVTTRFPRDAAARYAAEPDFKDWADRLEVFGLDMRHTPSVEAFTRFVLDRYDRLDFIVNNAAQTIRRPPRFYEHLLAGETAPFGTLAPEVRKLLSSYEEDLLQFQWRDDGRPPLLPVVGSTGTIVRQPLLLNHDGASNSNGADGSEVPVAVDFVKPSSLPSSTSECIRLPDKSNSNVLLPNTTTTTSSVKATTPVVSSSFSSSSSLPSMDYGYSLAGLARPAELSQVLLLKEDRDLCLSSAGPVKHASSSSPSSSTTELFPVGQLDQDMQQVDLRDINSWRLELHQVSTVELLETQLVNAVAPFVINARLKPLMEATPGAHKHIVNVSAMEGQFYRKNKTTKHPHTNMAKAALNMMTRTSAVDYLSSGINMNSVDTGWVTDENPVKTTRPSSASAPKYRHTGSNIDRDGHADDDDHHYCHDFQPPLDIVDGAARILDPIIDGINTGVHPCGKFLKDYKTTRW